jgi:hypothetical protein
MPSSASDAGAVALDGSESIPSKAFRPSEVLVFEPVTAARFSVPFARAPPLLSVVGEPTSSARCTRS